MNTYIAFLRGINVSGQKKIKMADLRLQIEELGFAQVQTYIQSGNLLFQSDLKDTTALAEKIQAKILADYDFEVPVLVLPAAAIKNILDRNPFASDPEKDPKYWYVSLLYRVPTAADIAHLGEVDYSPEIYVIEGQTLYFYAANGYGRAKMNNNLFEKKLKVSATTRNWRTMNKIWEMAQ